MNHSFRLKFHPPKPPKLPYSKTKYSKADSIRFKNIKQRLINPNKKELLADLDTLKKIILDNSEYFSVRKKAIFLVKRFPLKEAKLFLSQLFITYLYDETYEDRGFFMNHFLIYYEFWTMVDLDLYKNLFEQHWLEKCRHKRKLKLISVQLVKNFTKEECTRKLEEYSKKSKNKCVKENISIILNNLELIKK